MKPVAPQSIPSSINQSTKPSNRISLRNRGSTDASLQSRLLPTNGTKPLEKIQPSRHGAPGDSPQTNQNPTSPDYPASPIGQPATKSRADERRVDPGKRRNNEDKRGTADSHLQERRGGGAAVTDDGFTETSGAPGEGSKEGRGRIKSAALTDRLRKERSQRVGVDWAGAVPRDSCCRLP